LRHTGNQLAADAGASLRELMDRMGHSTARAAMIYLHGSDERQRAIADAISRRATSEFKPQRPNRPGTRHFLRMVRVRVADRIVPRCVSGRSVTGSVRLGAFCRRSPAWPCTQLTA
jgi:hypothetical protein